MVGEPDVVVFISVLGVVFDVFVLVEEDEAIYGFAGGVSGHT